MRQCQRPGCSKPTKGTARFCSPEHKREDYNERKREDRHRAIAAARRLLRDARICTCPTATEKIANASEDDRRRPRPIGRNFDLWLTKMQGRNECGRCAECREKLPTAGRLERLLRTTVALHRIILCSSGGCDLKFHREVKKHNGRRDFCIVLYPLKKGAPR